MNMKIGINLKGSREDYIGGLKGVKRKYKCCNGILLSKKKTEKLFFSDRHIQ